MRTEAINVALVGTFIALGVWPWWSAFTFYGLYLGAYVLGTWFQDRREMARVQREADDRVRRLQRQVEARMAQSATPEVVDRWK